MTEEVQARINAVRWYHAFEVLPGVITPGMVPFDARAVLDWLGMPPDLGGKRCLDVGTFDGPLAFEMEARGGKVYALDIQDPDCTAFNTARALRNSRVEFIRGTVNDLDRLCAGMKFDLITFFGVFYHLKNPIGAFEAISRSLVDDGVLLLEGEVLAVYSETIHGISSTLDNRALAESAVPLTLCYPCKYKGDGTNWFVPNIACLSGWMGAAGLHLQEYSLNVNPEASPYPTQRMMGKAVRAADMPILEEGAVFGHHLTLSEAWDRQYDGFQKRQPSARAGTSTAPAGDPRSAKQPEPAAAPAQRAGFGRRLWRRLVAAPRGDR
jgi:tRNA (mo5U34)-methyltransferase